MTRGLDVGARAGERTANLGGGGGDSLNGRFDPRRNSLNAIRLVLAALVIVSHSWALGGYGDEPQLGGANLGTWAVIGFFGLSGYLITRSRVTARSSASYYLARVLRIYPAFIVCLLVVAFGFAPLSTLLGEDYRYSLGSALGFVARNLPLSPPILGQSGIGTTLWDAPFPTAWDGPLWTLFYEASCYVLIGLVVTLVPRRLVGRVVVVLFCLATVGALLGDHLPVPAISEAAARLAAAFLAGSVCWLYGDRIRLSTWTYGVATVVLVAAVATGLATVLVPLPAAFLLVRAASVLPLDRVGAKFDVSYGIYIYGCPVQQTLVLAFGDRVSVWVLIIASLALTWPLAALSCVAVERPALALKRRFARREPGVVEAAW